MNPPQLNGPAKAALYLNKFTEKSNERLATSGFSEEHIQEQKRVLGNAVHTLSIRPGTHFQRVNMPYTSIGTIFTGLVQITNLILEITSNELNLNFDASEMEHIYDDALSLFQLTRKQKDISSDRILVCTFGRWAEELNRPILIWWEAEVEQHMKIFSCPKIKKYTTPSFLKL
ncbi:hypothetical protein [Microbulbifer epialgicus]|uniref:Uncharacterized protein n=1 Tax=Microbulbifer epialgicus TaxID=393907 RepID=A0ABV4P7Z7_9GAMM